VRTFFALIVLASAIFILLVGGAFGQVISTRTMTPTEAIPITLNPGVITTLLLPEVPSGTFGLGLVSQGNNSPGCIQIEHPPDSRIIVLHALSPEAQATMTVLMNNALYVFTLRCSPAPDVAVTLVKTESPTVPLAKSP
jgi:hypothetical protein